MPLSLLALIPFTLPKLSLMPLNLPMPSSKLNYFLNNLIVYPLIISSYKEENNKGSFLNISKSASRRFKCLLLILIY
jgi:hypothetical protein